MAREVILASDLNVSINDPVAGKTRITLTSITYIPGTGELLVLYNGALIVDYTEEDATHVILNFIPDITAPQVDTFEFITIEQGSSVYVPPPGSLVQLDPPKRPDNFGGRFIYP